MSSFLHNDKFTAFTRYTVSFYTFFLSFSRALKHTMSLRNTLLFLGPLIHSSSAYILRTTYDSTNFFDTSSFSFYDGYDVFNHGFTLYKSKADALSSGIAKITTDDKIYLGVDTTTKLTNLVEGPGNGRGSIRLESAETFDNGLLIADFEHMPAGGCGLWPA